MRDIAIFGVGGFGREVLTLIEDINRKDPLWNIVGFFDDGHEKGELVNGFPVLGKTDDLNRWGRDLALAISIGNPVVKRRIIERIVNQHIFFPTLIHPNVVVGSLQYVRFGQGCIVCAGNMITTNIEIGDFVILNLGCTVGHDTIIKDYAAFMPSCNISGEVVVEEGVYCGTGVKIINQTSIGEYAIVGAGAVVTKPIPGHCTAVGMPAKPIKFHD